MNAFIRTVLLVFAALFPIVNPVGMAPIFASMTFPYRTAIRRTMAFRIAINGIALMIASRSTRWGCDNVWASRRVCWATRNC